MAIQIVFGHGREFAASKFDVDMSASFFYEREVPEVTKKVINLSVRNTILPQLEANVKICLGSSEGGLS